MSWRFEHRQRLATGLADLVAGSAASFGAYHLRFSVLPRWLPVEGRTDFLPTRYLEALPIVILASLAATRLAGLRSARHTARAPTWSDGVRAGVSLGAIAAALALLYWDQFQYSRATIALAAGLFGPAVVVLRRAALQVVAAGVSDRPTAAVIGEGPPLRRLRDALDGIGPGAPRVVVVSTADEAAPWPGATRDSEPGILDRARRGELATVYIALPGERAGELRSLLLALEQTTADVHVVPDFGSAVLVNPGLTAIGDLPVLTLRESPLFGARALAKRALDVALAVLIATLAAPVLLVCALAVRLSSRGPILYRQERLGLDGRAFSMLKFRTMRVDAEASTGPVFTQPGDARVTPIGRFLRRFSLDELPQLWNVLRGDMSLVGPRPERRPFIEELRTRLPGYMLRHKVRAGMTGWAQVHGLRGESSREDRLRYDLEYIQNWSLSLDLEILGRTVLQVLGGRNAY